MEHIRDLDKSQRLVSQKPGYVQRGITVYPVIGGVAAHGF